MIRPRSKPRRGDVHDPDYLAWMHTHPCLVAGNPDSPCGGVLEAHHVHHHIWPDGRIERTGRDDTRTLPLCVEHHKEGRQAIHKLTADHGRVWDAWHGVDTEAAIARYQAEYVESGRELAA